MAIIIIFFCKRRCEIVLQASPRHHGVFSTAVNREKDTERRIQREGYRERSQQGPVIRVLINGNMEHLVATFAVHIRAK